MATNQPVALASRAWTHVPGTRAVEIYPIIHKPCFMCSSTFVLKTPREIIVIDPGGDRMETRQTRELVSAVAKEEGLPVFIFLTHCHIDHVLSVHVLTDDEPDWKIICHELTARILEEKDGALTMANMVDMTLPDMRASAVFFGKPGGGEGMEPHPFILTPSRFPIGEEEWLDCESFSIGNGDTMEIFHTPGHSPDSICFKVGSFLFSGDLHFATSPGAAGLEGWDGRKLALSAEGVMEIGRSGTVELVIPSHGIPFTVGQAERIFAGVRKEAQRLTDIAILDRVRADYVADYAQVLLEEAGTIFSIIAGRLLKISYYLDMLEESETAEEIVKAMDMDGIDRVIADFLAFSQALGNEPQVSTISKAVQFTRDIGKIFDPAKIHHLFEGFLFHRLRNLFIDYVNTAYGLRFSHQETAFDLNGSIRNLSARLKEERRPSDSISWALGTDEEFRNELVRRISYEPLFATLILDNRLPPEPLPVHADEAAFHDAVSSLLEQFAISKIDVVHLWPERAEGKIRLNIAPVKKDVDITLRTSKRTYLGHAMRMAGGSFRITEGDGTNWYVFELPSADAGAEGGTGAGHRLPE